MKDSIFILVLAALVGLGLGGQIVHGIVQQKAVLDLVKQGHSLQQASVKAGVYEAAK